MEKERVDLVVVGHVDHGKSTLLGRLLVDTSHEFRRKLAEIKRIGRGLNKDTELAYLVDQLKEEREQNKSIDTTQIFFKTRKKNYCIIDVPGHVEFIRNMITGASLAKACILIVDVQKGVMEQTRRHPYIISMLGIDKVIVILNKMDLADYQKEQFDKVKTVLLKFLENLQIKPRFIIPASAKKGINISKKSSRLQWYKGPTLLEALDSLVSAAIKSAKGPLRFPVQDVYKINGEKIIVGKIASGIVKQGQIVSVFPSFNNAAVKLIKIFGKKKTAAEKGENIGLILKGDLPVKRGDIIFQKENPPIPANRFKGNIFWMSEEPLQINRAMTLRCATQKTKCTVETIEKRINSSTLEIIEDDAKELRLNEAAIVTFRTEEPIIIEDFNLIEELGRFVIEDGYNLHGAGISAHSPK